MRSKLTPAPHVTLMDATLWDGEETPGFYLDEDRKIRLAHAPEEAGFAELEVGDIGAIDEHFY